METIQNKMRFHQYAISVFEPCSCLLCKQITQIQLTHVVTRQPIPPRFIKKLLNALLLCCPVLKPQITGVPLFPENVNIYICLLTIQYF